MRFVFKKNLNFSKLTLTSSTTNADGVEFKADFVGFKADGAQGTRGDNIKDGYNV